MKAILFDLDGTLLPMDQEVFTKAYFKELCKKMSPYGYDVKGLTSGVWSGTAAMVRNDGGQTNEDAFWSVFAGVFGDRVYEDKRIFNEFYENEFDLAKEVCGYDEDADHTIKELKGKGYRLILASNPIFPETAQIKRMRWAGVDPNDFDYITAYENSHFCKPNSKYYNEIIEKIGCEASECLMVGNDATEDMCAAKAGMDTFLLTNCLINSDAKDISVFHRGGFKQLMEYISLLEE